MPMYEAADLPESLLDVVFRIVTGGTVYGFELELLADHVSQ